jgi:hypothetical protein
MIKKFNFKNMEEILKTETTEYSFNYDTKKRCAEIYLPESVLSKSLPLTMLDNNYFNSISNGTATFTAESVSEESANNTLAKKVDLLCKDVYSSTSGKWEDAVDIKIFNSGTGCLYKNFNIKMREEKHETFNSRYWMFSAIDYKGNEIATMPIKKGVLSSNSNDMMGDLNLLAASFIFKTADIKIFLKLENDKSIKSSFNKFNYKNHET